MSGLRCFTAYYRRTTSRACLFVFTSSLLGLRSVLHYARTARHSQLSHTLVLFSLPSFHYVNKLASYHRLTLMTGPCDLLCSMCLSMSDNLRIQCLLLRFSNAISVPKLHEAPVDAVPLSNDFLHSCHPARIQSAILLTFTYIR